MAFVKRYLNKKIIEEVYRKKGLESLINFIKSPDSLIIEDDFSEKVCDIIDSDHQVVLQLTKIGLDGE